MQELQYLPLKDRRAFLKNKWVQNKLFLKKGIFPSRRDDLLEISKDIPYNPYYEELNKKILNGPRKNDVKEYFSKIENTGAYEQYFAHHFYNEEVFLLASIKNTEIVEARLGKKRTVTGRNENMMSNHSYFQSVINDNNNNKKKKKKLPGEKENTGMDISDDDNYDGNMKFEHASGSLLQNSEKIKEFLKKDNQLADLERLGNKKKTDTIVEDVLEKVEALNVNDWDNLTDYQQKKYVQQVVDNMLYIDGNKGILPYLCNCHSETAVDKWLNAMKAYLRFGYKAARRGDIQTFYGETYSKFFKQTSWESIRRYGKFRKYKMRLNKRGLQIDQKIRDAVVENLESLSAEHDLIALESNVSFANWSAIARIALYEKYCFFLPELHEQLQGGIFEELMDRKAFDDFVYVYCTLYTLIFNMSGATGATVAEPLTRNERPREDANDADETKED